jgi:hypothetical protein
MKTSLSASAPIAAGPIASGVQVPERTPAQRISYSAEKYGTMENFLGNPDFTLFKDQYHSGIRDLFQFVHEDVNGSNEKKDQETETLRGNFTHFLKNLFPTERPDAIELIHMEEAYGRGKEALDLLSELIADDTIPKMQLVDAIRILGPGLSVCLDGSAKHLDDCANGLQQSVGGKPWASFKQTLAEQHINAFLSSPEAVRKYPLYEGNIIHRVVGLTNALADDFGLAMQRDSYANRCKITPDLIKECRQHLASVMTQDALAHAFAEEYLAKITDAMNKSFAGQDTSAAFDGGRYIGKLDNIMEKLAPTYGLFGQSCVAAPLDDAYSRFRLLKDPSLIAKEILEKQHGVQGRQGAKSIIPKAFKRDVVTGSQAICIQTYGNNIFWKLDDYRDPQVLTITDFRHISPVKCDRSLAGFIDQAVKNSRPDALLTYFPAPWLSWVDIAILAAQLGEDNFSAFLDIHKNAMKDMPDAERLRFMGKVIADAHPDCIKRFAQNIPVLFPNRARREAALRKLLEIAVQRDNPDVMDAIRALSPSAKRSWEIPALKKNLPDALSQVSGKRPAQLAKQLFQWGEMTIEAREKQLLTSREFKNIFQGAAPAFVAAMGSGNCARIAAFGNILLSAYQKGMLEKKDIAALLTGRSGACPLEMALRNNQTGAVEAFGNIVLACYDMDILTERQLANILACPPRALEINPYVLRTQRESLERADSATETAFGTILQSFDFLRAGKTASDRSPISFFKTDPARLLDETKLCWLTIADLDYLAETLVKKGGLPTFLDDYQNILRKLPPAKRAETIRAVIKHGSVADFNFLTQNDSNAFSSNYAEDSLPPPFLAIAAKREDDAMAWAVNKFLLGKLKLLGDLPSRHTAEIISGELEYLLNINAGPSRRQAMAYLRRITVMAWQNRFFSAREFTSTFFDASGMPSSEISDALFSGHRAYMAELNALLLLAYKKEILDAGQIAMLLCGACSGHTETHVLVWALKTRNADAVAVFGDLVSEWRDNQVLTPARAANLIAPETDPSMQQLLAETDQRTADAYRKIAERHTLPPIAPDVALAAA